MNLQRKQSAIFHYIICHVVFLFAVLITIEASAHHVLGRPSYSLNEDSTTPPSMQVELQVGDYMINYMVFPAFPKANENGRINFYASRLDNGKSYKGDVTFTVRDDRWFNTDTEVLGSQTADDHIYHQGFVFSQNGDYIISAKFQDKGTPYTVDFPLRVGAPPTIGPVGIFVGMVLFVLVIASTVKRNRLKRIRTKRHHAEASNLN